MVFPLKVLESWVSHRIDDPAFSFVTPPLKKRQKKRERKEKIA